MSVLPAGCTGTLINSRTVLTAAHCIVTNGTIAATTGGVVFGNAVNTPTQAVLASALIPYANYSFPAGDIALISLTRPVTNVTPVTLAPAGYMVPVGATVTMVGYGNYGTGSNPPNSSGPSDDKRRVATTALGGYITLQNLPKDTDGDTLFSGANNPGQPVWAAQFRNPANPAQADVFGLTGRGVPILATEGGVAPGDSGGPLFYNDPVLGLIELGDVIGGAAQVAGLPANGYGELNIWTPTGVFANWIAANNPLQLVSANTGSFNWSNRAAWSGNTVPNNATSIVNYGGQPLQQVTVPRYYQVSLQNPGTVTVDINPTVDSLAITNARAALVVPPSATLTSLVSTSVTAGTLQLDGSHVTPQLTLTGMSALLAGRGTVQGNLTNTMGVVAPGGTAATGSLAVTGNYTQGMGGMLSIRLAGTRSDRLVVGGVATLGGGTLALSPAAGFTAVAGGTYTVLSAAQVTGDFTAVASTLGAALAPTVSTSAAAVNVSLAQVPFTSFAADSNAAGLARALTTVAARVPVSMLTSVAAVTPPAAASISATVSAIPDSTSGNSPISQLAVPTAATQVIAEAQDIDELDTLSAAQLSAALDSIAPQGVHVQSDAAREASIVTADAIATRLGNLRAGIGGQDYAGFAMQSMPTRPADSRDMRTAMSPGDSRSQVRLPEGVSTFLSGTVVFGGGGPGGDNDFTTAGVTAGIDTKIGQTGRLGVSLTYVNEGRAGTGATKANTQSILPVLYGSWSPGAFYLDGYAGGGWNTTTTHRPVYVGMDGYYARARAAGMQVMTGMTAGLQFTAGAITYGPLAAFDFDYAHFAAISEFGAGAFATSVDPRGSTSARGSIGARAEYHWQTAWGMVVPSVKATLTHDFGDQRDKAVARLQAAPDLPFGVTGPGWTNTYATVAVGVGTQLAKNVAASTVVQTYLGHGVSTQLSLQAVMTF